MRNGLIFLLIFISACGEVDYPHPFPVVITQPVKVDELNQTIFTAKIQNPDVGTKIVRYGFLYSTSERPAAGSTVIEAQEMNNGEFSVVVDRFPVGGQLYFMRSFVEIEGAFIYGSEVQFTSVGNIHATIDDFFPKEGGEGAEISIYGVNFSPVPQENTVKIGTLQCDVLEATESMLLVKIPPYVEDGGFFLTVTVDDHTTSSEVYFLLR
jgi:hypothetical protein